MKKFKTFEVLFIRNIRTVRKNVHKILYWQICRNFLFKYQRWHIKYSTIEFLFTTIFGYDLTSLTSIFENRICTTRMVKSKATHHDISYIKAIDHKKSRNDEITSFPTTDSNFSFAINWLIQVTLKFTGNPIINALELLIANISKFNSRSWLFQNQSNLLTFFHCNEIRYQPTEFKWWLTYLHY